MYNIPGYDQIHMLGNHHKLMGNGPVEFWGNVAVSGTAAPWLQVGLGSVYHYQIEGHRRVYVKTESNGYATDWVLDGPGVISETVAYGDFTDGGGAVGTYTSTLTIPAGAIVTRSTVVAVTGFAGNTSAALTIGDGTGVDRYNTSTIDVFTTASQLDAGAVSGTAWHTAAKAVVLTITVNSDWGLVSAGRLTYRIFYNL